MTFKLEGALRKAARQKRSCANQHLILILDKPLEKFPWESMPFLNHRSISRIPSLSFLVEHLEICKKVLDPTSAFYVLNPTGDLANTQKMFEKSLDR
jgi:separase